MGAELGATSSMFPSDHRTREFLESQGRGDVWTEILADEDAQYSEIIEMDLNPIIGNGDKIMAVDARINIKKS